jgi:hypothetical protein
METGNRLNMKHLLQTRHAHRSPLTAHRSPLTAHRSPLTAHRSPLTSFLRGVLFLPFACRSKLVKLLFVRGDLAFRRENGSLTGKSSRTSHEHEPHSLWKSASPPVKTCLTFHKSVPHVLWRCASLSMAVCLTFCGRVPHFLRRCASLSVAGCFTSCGSVFHILWRRRPVPHRKTRI